MPGGTDHLLCFANLSIFHGMFECQADDLNCRTTSEARSIVADLLKTRMRNAISLLKLVRGSILSAELRLRLSADDFVPENSGLKKASRKIGVSVSKPEELELAHGMLGNQKGIPSFLRSLCD
jgi:hypothetical protein